MKKQLITFLVFASFLCSSETLCQLNLNTVSINIGTIRTLFSDHSLYEDYRYSTYPEVQIGGDLFITHVRWILYWGYWTDGVEKPLPIADFITYSYSSSIVGARFGIVSTELLDNWPLQIGIFTGVAHHFITGTWVGGAGLDGRLGEGLTENVTTFEIGLNAEIIVIEPIAVRGELQQYIPLGNAYLDKLQKNRQSLKVGFALRF